MVAGPDPETNENQALISKCQMRVDWFQQLGRKWVAEPEWGCTGLNNPTGGELPNPIYCTANQALTPEIQMRETWFQQPNHCAGCNKTSEAKSGSATRNVGGRQLGFSNLTFALIVRAQVKANRVQQLGKLLEGNWVRQPKPISPSRSAQYLQLKLTWTISANRVSYT